MFISGAEDKHGYLWDRHYGVCLAKFPHIDVVNSVAFNPRDPEMLVTTSDDYTVKVWRSRNKVKQLGLEDCNFPRGLEVRRKTRCRHRSNIPPSS
jgi:F-box/WD-40 domain protein 5